MEEIKEVINFEILGYQVKFRPEVQGVADAMLAVERVKETAEGLLDKNAQLADTQAILLAALKLALENISLEREYQVNLEKFQSAASDALKLIDEVSPRPQ
ncbi:MAG: cell division protein ZapA [Bacteriovoracaceae bacterium]|jgi:hypothetical protein|nr:cell division protein ZapA [Bacteriovoracaceae bacterium]